MSAQKPALLSDRLAAAMSHPTRLHAMTMFWEREASPREIAEDLGEPVNNVTYHVNQLLGLGWIELVAQRPARGGRVVEHFYKAIRDSHLDDAELARLGDKERLVVDTTIISSMSKDISEAMVTGTFFARNDNQLTRIPLMVDEEGWDETKEILDRALDELMKVRETVLDRTASSGEETFPTKVEIIHFMSPPRKEKEESD
jgi:DNA-binding transcriptional ArsR family regulator